ncbi:hypothetical protein JB92DRAFT_3085088 [Gautieria morchelliformis]|nr:hypothetical protein JB92DRAFT_3085088 [Gautieria morchelliformis]
MVRHGYIGTAPLHPSLAFSCQVLELVRVLTARCPQLSLQSFVKSLCDLHRVPYHATFRNHLSTALDAYLGILRQIKAQINMVLQQDRSHWHLKNTCPSCMYVLEEEPKMEFSMLVAMDGNESLKRVERAQREKTSDGRPIDGVDQPNPCIERWGNLADDSTKKHLGIFHETGLFVAVCRHGCALVICDMVQSGELAKYGLAVTNELLDAFGPGLMLGYDIGCGFSTTVNNSKLVGPKLHQHHAQFCVGSFHGHAHCRSCQLDWHPLYIKGCGLEDFETCERVFSRSNALASSTRHTSAFHRRQLIHRWFETWNQEKVAEMSSGQIATLSPCIEASMKAMNLPSAQTFEEWREAEKEYLSNLKHEPEGDILKMQYLETLVKLMAANQWKSADITDLQGIGAYAGASASSRHLEMARARSLETLLTLQEAVQDLESKLEIGERWEKGSPAWIATQAMIDSRAYRQAINKLEGLVVGRLFELGKVHQAGTGYKLQKHIGKALKSRSEAIRNAVKKYNYAAAMLKPPRPPLDIQTVLNHVYLGQFDLLRESCHNIAEKPWAHATAREATTAYFKLRRSHEEVTRVLVEARRLQTWMKDEENLILHHIEQLQVTRPALAFQMRWDYSLQRLAALEADERFDGKRGPGVRKGQEIQDLRVEEPVRSDQEVELEQGDEEGEDEDALQTLESTMTALSLYD